MAGGEAESSVIGLIEGNTSRVRNEIMLMVVVCGWVATIFSPVHLYKVGLPIIDSHGALTLALILCIAGALQHQSIGQAVVCLLVEEMIPLECGRKSELFDIMLAIIYGGINAKEANEAGASMTKSGVSNTGPFWSKLKSPLGRHKADHPFSLNWYPDSPQCFVAQLLIVHNSSPASTVPMKRKRGRPCKQESGVQGDNKPVIPGSANSLNSNQTGSPTDECGDKMLGKVVACVIEGSFSAGYLVNVQVAADAFLRGVVFRPETVGPVTAESDVAPLVRMIKRKDTPIPFFNPETQMHSPIPMPSKQINITVDNFMQKQGSPETDTKTKLVIEISTKAGTSNSNGSPSTGIANILDVGEAVPSQSKHCSSTY
ncbi:hypothetical protein VNO77_01730 [Canavalia gladiata]|uniref:Uncharacterized protein n=1 Tax=Canavalia gladiata TaxID=3824 RepID=A0AAN9R2D9_CANGL